MDISFQKQKHLFSISFHFFPSILTLGKNVCRNGKRVFYEQYRFAHASGEWIHFLPPICAVRSSSSSSSQSISIEKDHLFVVWLLRLFSSSISSQYSPFPYLLFHILWCEGKTFYIDRKNESLQNPFCYIYLKQTKEEMNLR